MPGTNIFKEQLQCNEKEWNVKNIVFDPPTFRRIQKTFAPTHPRYFF